MFLLYYLLALYSVLFAILARVPVGVVLVVVPTVYDDKITVPKINFFNIVPTPQPFSG